MTVDKQADAEAADESSEEESEYEEYTDSEEEDDGPMLKPVIQTIANRHPYISVNQPNKGFLIIYRIGGYPTYVLPIDQNVVLDIISP